MATDGGRSAAPMLIGAGLIAQSVGYVILAVSTLAALGLDRSGYPVLGWLGHPLWILAGALLSVIGGISCGYGCLLGVSAWNAVVPRRAPAVSGSR